MNHTVNYPSPVHRQELTTGLVSVTQGTGFHLRVWLKLVTPAEVTTRPFSPGQPCVKGTLEAQGIQRSMLGHLKMLLGRHGAMPRC